MSILKYNSLTDYWRHHHKEVEEMDKSHYDYKYFEIYNNANPGHPSPLAVHIEKQAYKHQLYDTKKELAKSKENEKALQDELSSIKKELAESRYNEMKLQGHALGHVQNIKSLYKCIKKKKRCISKMNTELNNLNKVLGKLQEENKEINKYFEDTFDEYVMIMDENELLKEKISEKNKNLSRLN